jgi:DNA-binding LytR/AlgR family response regulator
MQLPGAGYLRWIKASVGQTVRLIPVDDVLYFQSDDKYTRVVMDEGEVLIRKPIKELVEELDPERFWQIHRATIVNTLCIAGVVRGLRDQADLKLKDRPETLTVSRNYTHLFKQM